MSTAGEGRAADTGDSASAIMAPAATMPGSEGVAGAKALPDRHSVILVMDEAIGEATA